MATLATVEDLFIVTFCVLIINFLLELVKAAIVAEIELRRKKKID